MTDKQARRKSSKSLVVLDNPDDGEIFDTGDASDFAGRKTQGQEDPGTKAQKTEKAAKRREN